MTYRFFDPNHGFVKAVPDVFRERVSKDGTSARVCIDLGPNTLRMSNADAVRLADALIDATESRPRPYGWVRRRRERKPALNRGNHAKPTPATPAWTSASAAYNYPES